MPKSIDPEPAENEIECGRCGAHFYYELTRCPQCGVSVYEPEEETEQERGEFPKRNGILEGIQGAWHRLFRKPYSAEQIFGDSLNQAGLYNDLLQRVGGNRQTADRLIDFECQRSPGSTRLAWIKSAIQRWDKDNLRFGSSG